MLTNRLFLHLRSLHLQSVMIDGGTVIMTAAVKRPCARCPLCGHSSTRVHSQYWRIVADLPVSQRAVVIVMQVRRFRCLSPKCPRRIFAERLPDLVAPYARKSRGLHQALVHVAFVAGGEAGARLARHLGMQTSPDTLLLQQLGTRIAPFLAGTNKDIVPFQPGLELLEHGKRVRTPADRVGRLCRPAADTAVRTRRRRLNRWVGAAQPIGRTRADPLSLADHVADSRRWPHRRPSTAGTPSRDRPSAPVSPAARVSSRCR